MFLRVLTASAGLQAFQDLPAVKIGSWQDYLREYLQQRSELLVRAVWSWLVLDSALIWGWLTKRETAFPMDLCSWGAGQQKDRTGQKQYFDN